MWRQLFWTAGKTYRGGVLRASLWRGNCRHSLWSVHHSSRAGDSFWSRYWALDWTLHIDHHRCTYHRRSHLSNSQQKRMTISTFLFKMNYTIPNHKLHTSFYVPSEKALCGLLSNKALTYEDKTQEQSCQLFRQLLREGERLPRQR